MPLQNQKLLQNLIDNQEIEALKALAVPVFRRINYSIAFRSAMMLSTHNLKHLLKISTLNAECIILNLEDGVSPQQKPYALALCAMALASNPQCDKKMVVRVNPLDEGGEDEIRFLNSFMPDAIRVPKIRTPRDVERIVELIDKDIEIHLSIETKEAWLNLSQLASNPRVKVFYLGVLDLFADLGLSQGLLMHDNPMTHYLLSHFLITSHALGVKPVSFVYQDYKNSDGLCAWLELEKSLGFDAKGCISPTQVDLIHSVFIPQQNEIERCKEIVRLFEEHAAIGISGFVDERYGFIDEPIYKGALSQIKGR